MPLPSPLSGYSLPGILSRGRATGFTSKLVLLVPAYHGAERRNCASNAYSFRYHPQLPASSSTVGGKPGLREHPACEDSSLSGRSAGLSVVPRIGRTLWWLKSISVVHGWLCRRGCYVLATATNLRFLDLLDRSSAKESLQCCLETAAVLF